MCVFIFSPLSMELLGLLRIVSCKTQLPFLESGSLETEVGHQIKQCLHLLIIIKKVIRLISNYRFQIPLRHLDVYVGVGKWAHKLSTGCDWHCN